MLDLTIPHFSLHRCFLCPDGGNWLADMTLGDIHSNGVDETVIVCRTQKGLDILDSAGKAGYIKVWKMNSDQVNHSVIKHITRSKLLPAIVWNAWLKKRGKAFPGFDYDAGLLIKGRLKFMALFWILKYHLTFWCRKGRQRNFLLKHLWIMEKVGHFLYYFPNTLPGWKLLIRMSSQLRK